MLNGGYLLAALFTFMLAMTAAFEGADLAAALFGLCTSGFLFFSIPGDEGER